MRPPLSIDWSQGLSELEGFHRISSDWVSLSVLPLSFTVMEATPDAAALVTDMKSVYIMIILYRGLHTFIKM